MASGAGAEKPNLEPGAEFAGHRIVGILGQGGMGVVYRATNLTLERDRALKVIAPALSDDPRFRERFKRESRLAARIEHPNVIPVHAAGEENGMAYLAMRLVEGTDLKRATGEGGLGPERAATIIAGVAKALDAAHAANLVHRDVKPANILIERETGHVYLTDFGITRLAAGVGETITDTGEFVGSVEYVAPEQAAGEAVNARTDIYSLGGVAHFALTGNPPFPRDTQLATLFAHANAPRPRPAEMDPSLPPAVDAVIVKAMATDPRHRYASAGELADDLARALGLAPGAITAGDPTLSDGAEFDRDAGETVAGVTSAGRDDPEGSARPRQMRQERVPRRTVRLLVALIAGLAAIVAIALIITGGGGEPSTGGNPGASSRGNTAAAAPAINPEVVATIPLGAPPNALTVGEEVKVWVAEPDADVVEGIDTEIESVVPPTADAPDASSVAVGFGSIWTVSQREDVVYRLDPAEGTEPTAIPVGRDPSDIAVDRYGVWVTNEGSDDVMRIDPASNEVTVREVMGSGASPHSVAVGGGSVWVANIDGRNVIQLDGRSGQRIGSAMPMGSRPTDLCFGENTVWVVDNIDGTVARIDPLRQEQIGEPLEVGAKPRGTKFGFGFVWIANGGDGNVVAVDPDSFEIAGEVQVGKDPADVAIGESSVWTANQGSESVSRIEPDAQ